jgi:hypothetical protein
MTKKTSDTRPHVFISARSDSDLGSIITAALRQNNISVVYPAQDISLNEIRIRQVRDRISSTDAAIVIIEAEDGGAMGGTHKSETVLEESEPISEKVEIVLKRIQELEVSFLLSTSNIKTMKAMLRRIHKVLLESNKQLEQHKVRLGGIDRAFVEELIDGISELIEQAIMVKN